MKNLDQIRAAHAVLAAGKIGTGKEGGRAVAKKAPALIEANGFLGALAFAIEAKEGILTVFQAVIDYLVDNKMAFGITQKAPEGFFAELCTRDAATLRAVTAETMAYLSYLRRFAKPEKRGSDKDGE